MDLTEILPIENFEEEINLEPLYRVIIHNDDLTPMDFVVHVLKTIFFLSNDRAAEIMLAAHIKGNAYVQTLPKTESEKRVKRAHSDAHNAGYPLKFTMEPE